ncbi:MAG: RNA methyltransferase [Candidatus Marsarchaeota archaeon]|jgi:TrmH family RNA methyltransferase|nr:RNA methyltransferase [Candidatus Marsarchaeota archaeon]
MELKLVIVSPKYQMNVGYMARVARNFGIKKLFFVKPRANIHGNKAIMYSKHAVDMLKQAKVYKNFDDAISNCDMVIGTTGIIRKGPRFDNMFTPEDALAHIEKNTKEVAILIGRDDTGLSVEELGKCDILVNIASNADYPVLNISHALAVLLYVFTKKRFAGKAGDPEKPSEKEVATLMAMFDRMISMKNVRDSAGVKNVFRKMIRRSRLNRHELHAIITAFK